MVRLVYDGPPFSGKTTTLRSLSESWKGSKLQSPEESNGRTVYFDWVEYVGGLYDGRPIRCQVVSVPGQVELRHRRRYLLDHADAVIFVSDTRDGHFQPTLELLRTTVEIVRQQDPPLGLVLQANKRDTPEAMARSAVKRLVDALCPMPFVDTVATNGEGIREAFVLGIGLALDRVRALAELGQLETRTGAGADSALALLGEVRGLDSQRGVQLAAVDGVDLRRLTALDQSPRAEWTPGSEIVFQPDPYAESGRIWPPLDGRSFVHDAARANLVPIRASSGDWWASGSGWRFHSRASAVYANSYEARRKLIAWARMHADAAPALSKGRALTLADAGEGRQRLWQLVQIQPSLRERLATATEDAASMATELAFAAERLLSARRAFMKTLPMARATLWTTGGDEGEHPSYVGMMPGVEENDAERISEGALIEREFMPQLQQIRQDSERFAELRRRLNALRKTQGAAILADFAERMAAATTPKS